MLGVRRRRAEGEEQEEQERGEEGEEGEEGEGAEAYGEVYEDTELYHALLKDLLDDGNDGALPASGVPKLKHKKRKTDNRQSKGRKLSYDVMPKLQNFMFPVIPDRPVILTELFASVFGQRAPANGARGKAAASQAVADGSAIAGSLFAPTN